MKRPMVFGDKGGPGKTPIRQFFARYLDCPARSGCLLAENLSDERTLRTHESRKVTKLAFSRRTGRTRGASWTY